MTKSLEDVSAPSTTASLLRSFIGVHLRRIGNWIAVGDLVELIGEGGVTSNSTRSALSRLKGKGLLIPETRDGRAGHLLDASAVAMLERGDRRIYGYHQMAADEEWMLILFSVPESERHLRHQLRTALTWMGCGMVANGSWIGPGHLLPETRQVLDERGLLRYVTTVLTRSPEPPVPLDRAVAQWWDLPALSARYDEFIQVAAPIQRRWAGAAGDDVGRAPDGDPRAFVDHLTLVDNWRSIPYLDPGLPYELLPSDWAGRVGVDLFAQLHGRLYQAAARHVAAAVRR